MTSDEQKHHLNETMNGGVSRLDNTKSSFFESEKSGYPPDANNPKGSQFWMNSADMDPVWNSQDAKLAEHALGYNEDQFTPGVYERRNLNDPASHNARCAQGNEPGVGEQFNGIKDPNTAFRDPSTGKIDQSCIDMNKYDGMTSGQYKELVTDAVSKNDYSTSGQKEFYIPEYRANELVDYSKAILSDPNATQKDIADHNAQVNSFSARIDEERTYLNNRANDFENRIKNGECNGDALKESRFKAEADWCRNHSQELQEAQTKAQGAIIQNENKQSNDTNSGKQVSSGMPTTSQSGKNSGIESDGKSTSTGMPTTSREDNKGEKSNASSGMPTTANGTNNTPSDKSNNQVADNGRKL